MLAMRKPTSPAASCSTSTGLGVSTPSVSTSNVRPFDIRRMRWPLRQRALDHAGQHDHAAIGIEPGIENQRLQLIGRRGPWAEECCCTIASSTSGTPRPVLALMASACEASRPTALFDHLLGALDVGAGQVDLVDDGNDLQPVIDRDVGVGQRLRFDALRRVHHQQRAFARGQRARDFVAEVHVAGRVDQVELIGLAVLRRIHHAHRVRLDGDAALALQVHGVEHLRLHLTRRQRAGQLQQAVGKRALPMIDMGDDREISDE